MAGYVGLDLSLTGSGLAYDGGSACMDVCVGQCVLIGEEGITKLSVAQRFGAVDRLAGQILDQVGAWNPATVLVEQLDMARSYGGTIERTALWWLVVREIDRAGIPVLTAASAQGKIYATGKSNATKREMVHAVAELLPQFPIRDNDNLADAAVYCAMCSAVGGVPLAILPDKHLRALDNVKSIHDLPKPKSKPKPRSHAT